MSAQSLSTSYPCSRSHLFIVEIRLFNFQLNNSLNKEFECCLGVPFSSGFFVTNKLFASFLNCIISQMHEYIFAVSLGWFFVLLGGKSSQSFFIHKYTKRIARCYSYIHSQIKFEPINNKRLIENEHFSRDLNKNKKKGTYPRYVYLSNIIITGFYVFIWILGNKYTTSLTTAIGFTNVRFVFFQTSVVN